MAGSIGTSHGAYKFTRKPTGDILAIDRIKEILDAAGPRYQIHDPSSWPAQAKFAAEGKFDELKEYQEMLIGGRDVTE